MSNLDHAQIKSLLGDANLPSDDLLKQYSLEEYQRIDAAIAELTEKLRTIYEPVKNIKPAQAIIDANREKWVAERQRLIEVKLAIVSVTETLDIGHEVVAKGDVTAFKVLFEQALSKKNDEKIVVEETGQQLLLEKMWQQPDFVHKLAAGKSSHVFRMAEQFCKETKKPFNINAVLKSDNSEQEAPLHCAVRAQQLNIIKELMRRINRESESGQAAAVNSIYQFNKAGYLPLHLAINTALDIPPQQRDTALAIAETLLSSGMDVDAKTKDGKTALQLALNKSDDDLIEWLLSHGADPSLMYPSEEELHDKFFTPLARRAASRENLGLLLALEKSGAKIQNYTYDNDENLAHIATHAQVWEIQKYLASKYPGLYNTTNTKNRTPLDLQGDVDNPPGPAKDNDLTSSMVMLMDYTESDDGNFEWQSKEFTRREALEKLTKNDDEVVSLMPKGSDVEILVYKGGGPKGAAFPKAMEVLIEQGVFKLANIKEVIGTSAGSIFSAFLAFGYDPAKTKEVVFSKDFTEFLDSKYLKDLVTKYAKQMPGSFKEVIWDLFSISRIRQVTTLLQDNGLCKGDKFVEWLKENLREPLRELKLEEHKQENLTFKELHELVQLHGHGKFKDLTVFAVDANTGELEEFNWQKTPNVVVWSAVRASMSIPGLFELATVFEKNELKELVSFKDGHKFFDGGVRRNYPLRARDVNGKPNPKVLGFALVEEDKRAFYEGLAEKLFAAEPENIPQVLLQVFNAASAEQGVIADQFDPRTVRIFTDISLLEFNMSQARKLQADGFGEAGALDYLNRKEHAVDVILSAQTLEVLIQYGVMTNSYTTSDHVEVAYNKHAELSPEQVYWIYASAEPAEIPLLRCLVNPNARNVNGQTALFYANAFADGDNAKFNLKSANANLSVLDKNGRKPGDVAANDLPQTCEKPIWKIKAELADEKLAHENTGQKLADEKSAHEKTQKELADLKSKHENTKTDLEAKIKKLKIEMSNLKKAAKQNEEKLSKQHSDTQLNLKQCLKTPSSTVHALRKQARTYGDFTDAVESLNSYLKLCNSKIMQTSHNGYTLGGYMWNAVDWNKQIQAIDALSHRLNAADATNYSMETIIKEVSDEHVVLKSGTLNEISQALIKAEKNECLNIMNVTVAPDKVYNFN